MVIDFPRMNFQSQRPKRGLVVFGSNGISSRRMEDKQRSMRIDQLSGISSQEHLGNLTLAAHLADDGPHSGMAEIKVWRRSVW